MIAIMTVTGLDHTGIIAAVSTALAELDVNILNVSQTIMDDYFTMILHVRIDDSQHGIAAVQDRMAEVEKQEKLVIRVQSEAIFSAMHDV
ncbi:ACT domain-containing protein [Corynebacterium sp. YSMAA1_1_F7]|uniref:ACT domain-containing protein n=1 Tax=Corynebacterium sp. YSMAA1_1_F7 TaxID=3383590 RepID=UPI0025E32763|nr:ACT domain-containing protein [uncultured Corynebacterium sp.]